MPCTSAGARGHYATASVDHGQAAGAVPIVRFFFDDMDAGAALPAADAAATTTTTAPADTETVAAPAAPEAETTAAGDLFGSDDDDDDDAQDDDGADVQVAALSEAPHACGSPAAPRRGGGSYRAADLARRQCTFALARTRAHCVLTHGWTLCGGGTAILCAPAALCAPGGECV
jgi:hypothetical protein